jgi:hypothetical protein
MSLKNILTIIPLFLKTTIHGLEIFTTDDNLVVSLENIAEE